MGKKQHQSDKLYLTTQEWKYFFGGKKPGRSTDPDEVDFKRLPVDHCALSLQPYETPYCDEGGHIFDLIHIVPYIKKFKTNPCTGETLDAKGLIKLKFTKNASGEPHCPVMFKVFNNNTHIAAIKTTGNVFCYEAIEELNLKTKNFKDLISDEPFTRDDIIVLQDPKSTTKFNLSTFHHIKHKLKVSDEDLTKAKTDPRARLKKVNPETKDTLKELDRTYKAPEVVKELEIRADKFNAAPYSTGKVSASFTSTATLRETTHEAAILHEDIVRYSRVKKKGYVRLNTNQGPLNLELNCDVCPKACENFMKLCQAGYYNGTVFHRSIRHFMIQGGDPTGTGTGGKSHFGEPFVDEFRPNLTFTGRGILAMANSGENTNKSQFFITYRSCKHLEGKHSIFGKLVGGMDSLANMERIGTDNKDRPVEDIILERASVFVDPFTEADEELAREREEELSKSNAKDEKKEAAATEAVRKVFKTSGVGKYINPNLKKEARKAEPEGEPAKKKVKNSSYSFGNFNSW